MHLPSSVLASWQHTVATATTHTVLPDGCRDLIHPGATLDAAALLQTTRNNPPDGVQSLLARVDSLVRVDGRTTEALQSLSAAPSVATHPPAFGQTRC